jgi:HPt (histidine-containing phosphotransfer) domain-containing protein
MTDAMIDQEVYQALIEAVGEDFIEEMVEAFLEEGTQLVADLGKGLADRDIDLFRRAAHSLKSNAATFGAMKLSHLSEELEEMARQGQLEGATDKLAPISEAYADAEQALKELNNG